MIPIDSKNKILAAVKKARCSGIRLSAIAKMLELSERTLQR